MGSTRALLNTSGTLTDTYRYDAFGTLRTSTGSTTNVYRFTGQQFDPLTGDYSLRARYYAPNTGRFLSRDTWRIDHQNPLELNRYVYAANNPVLFTDPSGFTLAENSLSLSKTTMVATGALATYGSTAAFVIMFSLLAVAAVTLPRELLPPYKGPDIDTNLCGSGQCKSLAMDVLEKYAVLLASILAASIVQKWQEESSLIMWGFTTGSNIGFGVSPYVNDLYHIFLSIQTPVGSGVIDNFLHQPIFGFTRIRLGPKMGDIVVQDYITQFFFGHNGFCEEIPLTPSALKAASEDLPERAYDLYYNPSKFLSQPNCSHN